MIGSALRHLVQFIGVLAAGGVLLLGIVAWRLTAGPISLAYLTPYFEAALSAPDGAFSIRLTDTILSWEGWDRSFEIRLKGARAIAGDGATIAEVPELALTLSAHALFRGKLALSGLSIFGPSLTVQRHADGGFEIGALKGKRADDPVLAGIMGQLLSPPERRRALSYLTRLSIVGGDLTLEDEELGVTWRAPEADITLTRGSDGITGEAKLDLRAGSKLATLNLEGNYRFADGRLDLAVGFADLRPSEYADLSPRLKRLAALRLPVSGTLVLGISRGRGLEDVAFAVSGTQGEIGLAPYLGSDIGLVAASVRGRFERERSLVDIEELTLDLGEDGRLVVAAPLAHEFPLRKVIASGQYRMDFGLLELKKLKADLAGPTLEASGLVQEIGGEITFVADTQVRDLPTDRAGRYWPRGLARFTRDWILGHISGGAMTGARARITGAWDKKGGFQLSSLTGDLDFKDWSIDYLAPMPKAVKTNGHAKFNRKTMEITIDKAKALDLQVTSGRIVFTGFDKLDQFARIDLVIEGPFRSALRLIDHAPLGYAKAVGIDPRGAKGQARTELGLGFIVERTLTRERIKIDTKASITGAAIPKMAFGRDLTRGTFTLSADGKGMDVAGSAHIGTIDAQFDWRENFTDKAPFKRRYRVKASLTDAQRAAELGLGTRPFTPEFLTGTTPADLEYTILASGEGRLRGTVSLDGVAMNLAEFGWSKAPGVPGKAHLDMRFANGLAVEISDFKVNAGGLRLEGDADFDAKGGVARVGLTRIAFDRNDFAAQFIRRGAGWDVDLWGARLDLAPWLEADGGEDDDEKGTPVSLSVMVKRVRMGADSHLDQVSGRLDFDGTVWREIQLAATPKDGKEMTVALATKDGKRTLAVASDDAGAVLRAFGFYDDLVGGVLDLRGTYDDDAPGRPLNGQALIKNFRVIKAPVLTHLLSIASLTGILEALGGEGLAFTNLEVPFTKRGGIIALQDAKASGLSLGMTATGALDTETETLRLSGTIVPAYLINSFLGHIPVIGGLFTGGEKGGGVFAATYRMRGNLKKPEVSVNPLSALAPGFLRNLFGIFDRDDGIQAAPLIDGAGTRTN